MKSQWKKRTLLTVLAAILLTFGALADDRLVASIDVKNVTVEHVLKEIERQTPCRFSYAGDILKNLPRVSLKSKKRPVTEILDRIFSGTGLTYKAVSPKSIVILANKKGSDTKGDETGVRTSGKRITGQIVDKEKEPVIGASVLVKGTRIGASTDLDGNFILQDVPEGSTVTVTYVGMTPASFKVGRSDRYDITMQPTSEMLDEVVVVGYGAQKKVNLTGAVSTLSQEELKDRPIDNLGRALQGLIPNLNVSVSSGQPGAGASLNVRGNTSPNGGSPLVLVDGIESSLDRINSNDVESISVLKDASSAAIYGARGAFGVILVTTKSGKSMQKPQVSYSGSFSTSKPTTSTDFETRGYYSAKIADFFMLSSQNTPYTSYTESDYQALWDRRNDKTENPDRPWVLTRERNGRQEYLYLANFDWYNYLYDDSRPTWDHNLNIRGAFKSLSYMVSGRYNQQKGINRIQPDKFRSYNFRVKLQAEITPKLTISNNTKFFSSEYSYSGMESEYDNFRRPTLHALSSMVPVNPDGTAVSHTSITNSSAHFLMDGYNAMLQKGKSGGHKKVREFSTLFEVQYKIIPQLDIKADFSYTYGNLRNDYRSVNVEYSQYPGVIQTEPEGRYPNSLKETVWDQNYYVADIYASYQDTWKGLHNFSAILGYNYESKQYRDLGAKNTGLLSEDLSDFNLATGKDNFSITGGRNEYAIMGIFYRAAYNYDGRYLVEVNGRYDGSSRFPRGKRYGFFPSFSVGYRISEEKFFEPLRSIVSNAKIRASYGSLGNQQIGYYDFIQTISTGGHMNDYSFNRENLGSHATVSDPVSANQTWEKVITKNLGLDLGFFNNRLSFTGEVYTRDVKGILGRGKSLPSLYGASEPQVNANDLRTLGYELMLTWNHSFNLGGSPFSYTVGVNFSDYTSKYTKCDNPSGLIGDPYVGRKEGEIWGYMVDGLFRNDEEAKRYADEIDLSIVAPGCYNATGAYGTGVRGGDLRYLDLDGNKIVNSGKGTLDDPGDRRIIGNSTPRYHYGINLSAEWKGIDLSVFVQGIGRQDWYPGSDNMRFWGPYARPYGTFVPRNFMSDVWSESNPDAYFPRARAYSSLNTTNGTVYYANDRYLQNLAYCRLKNVTIGYTFPAKWMTKIRVTNLRIYVSGENLLTTTALRSHFLDPEQASAASNKLSNVYPWSKTFSVGVNLSF